MKTLQSPGDIDLLMKVVYSRHQAGMKRIGGNIFMVGLPPLTEEEIAKLNRNKKKYDEDQEVLFGGWI